MGELSKAQYVGFSAKACHSTRALAQNGCMAGLRLSTQYWKDVKFFSMARCVM
jgi:hypothetical protein